MAAEVSAACSAMRVVSRLLAQACRKFDRREWLRWFMQTGMRVQARASVCVPAQQCQ